MKSRLDKYYESDNLRDRTSKNQQLYRTIYEEAEYSNIEGISVIEKNEKINMEMIRELINKNNSTERPKQIIKYEKPIIVEEQIDDEKSYDIRDVLSKAKDERVTDDKKIFDTQYNILKNINLNEQINVPDIKDGDLKEMIEAISTNSKGYTSNLLDDLKSIYDATMHQEISNELEKDNKKEELDSSFYTAGMNFKEDDFDDINEVKNDTKQNTVLTTFLIIILSLILISGLVFLLLHFLG